MRKDSAEDPAAAYYAERFCRSQEWRCYAESFRLFTYYGILGGNIQSNNSYTASATGGGVVKT